MENNNHIPDQYKGALETLNKKIGDVEKDIDINGDDVNFIGEYTKRKKISSLFYNFMIQNFPKGTNLAYIINITDKIIETHPRFAFEIIDGFTQGYIDTNKNWEDIGYCIHYIINKNGIKNSQNLVSNIINGFVQGFFKKSNDIGFLIKEIRQIIIANTKSAFEIIDGFTQGCLNKNQTPKDIGKGISEIIKEGTINRVPNLVSNIINGFKQGCIDKNQILEEIGKGISEIIKEGTINRVPDLVSNIISDFTRTFILKRYKLEHIGRGISEIIKEDIIKEDKINSVTNLVSNIINGFTQGAINTNQYSGDDIYNCILKIINTEEINYYPSLVIRIIDGFVQGSLTAKPNDIQGIAKSFSKLLDIDFGEKEEENEEEKKKKAEIKTRLRPILASIVARYRTNGQYKQETEEQLVECYEKLFGKQNADRFRNRLQSSCPQTNPSEPFSQPIPLSPQTNISKNGKGPTGESSTEANLEKTGGLSAKLNKSSGLEQNKYSNDRKRKYDSILNSNSEKINESFTSKRQEQQDQPDYRSRY